MRRLWESRAWSDGSMSVTKLLERLLEDGVRCEKTDREVLDRWSACVADVFKEHRLSPALATLYSDFVNKIESFTSPSDLLRVLKPHPYADTTLTDLIGATSSSGRRGRHTDVGGAGAEEPDWASQMSTQMHGLSSHFDKLHATPASLTPSAAQGEVSASVYALQLKGGRLVLGHADFSKLSALDAFAKRSSPPPMFDADAEDGRFTLNCPFCEVGASATREDPVKCYRSIKAYESEHGCSPFLKESARRIEPTERTAHFSTRCGELWWMIRRHIEADPSASEMARPLSDATFYSTHLPGRLQQQRRF